jgi:translation initiation factor IF-2
LSKLRVHDLAGEFGVHTDEVINLLRQMDVPVRSHLSPLSDDQVARIRARWEREKRARSAAPPAAARRRRGTAAAATAEAKPEPTAPVDSAPSKRRRRVAAEPTIEAAAPEVSTSAEQLAPPPALAPAPIAASMPAETPTIERPRAPVPPPRPSAPLPPPQTASHGGERGDSRERQRPQPVVPGAPRPRPVATGAPYAPPRPVASAAPGAGTAPARREDRGGTGRGEDRGGRRGKKGKRGVDQEAVSANIGKTMASMRGPIRRGGARRAEDGT